MKQFLKMIVAVFIAMSAREFVILGLKKMVVSLNETADEPSLGPTGKPTTPPKMGMKD